MMLNVLECLIQFSKVMEMDKNRLKEVRISEGITISSLSRASNVSAKVISETERLLRDPREVTKSKILNGLNKLTNGRAKKYSFDDIFSEG